jgi:hypothetical protein
MGEVGARPLRGPDNLDSMDTALAQSGGRTRVYREPHPASRRRSGERPMSVPGSGSEAARSAVLPFTTRRAGGGASATSKRGSVSDQ